MPNELTAALIKVQQDMPIIKRNAKGQAGTRPHRYADLSAVHRIVLPLLAKNGLAFTTRPTLNHDGRFILAYSLIHTSGERIDGEYPLPDGSPAQLGSALTYARRYCLCAVTGAAPEAEDDDGGAAAHTTTRAQPRVRTAHSDPEHTRLVQGITGRGANGDRPAQRTHGPVPDDENPWQDIAAEERPGSAKGSPFIGAIQARYQRLGFKYPDERDDVLAASEKIIGRGLSIGPEPTRSHNNLSLVEARKLRDTLDSIKDRGELIAQLAAAAVPS